MDNQICWWFAGFEAGLETLPQEERGNLLHACAENCLQRGMLAFYRGICKDRDGDIDQFFQALGELEGLDTEIIVPQKEFWLIFHQCTCALHTQGYINSSLLCDCSRQSVLCILKELLPQRRFSVEPEGTILGGAPSCRFHITALEG